MPISWPPNASAFAGSNSLLVTPAVVVAVAVIGCSFLSMTAMLVFKRLLHIGETTGHKKLLQSGLDRQDRHALDPECRRRALRGAGEEAILRVVLEFADLQSRVLDARAVVVLLHGTADTGRP